VDEWQCVKECPARKLGEQSGQRSVGGTKANRIDSSSWFADSRNDPSGGFGDKGTAARFFFQADWSHEIAERIADSDPVYYCPKAPRKQRTAGIADTFIMPRRNLTKEKKDWLYGELKRRGVVVSYQE